MSHAFLRGLYAIIDSAPLAGPALMEQVEAALVGGAAAIQYRDKSTDPGRRLQEARALVALCRHHGVPLIVNDDVALARASGAAGVHLGAEDATVAAARAQLGPEAIIGVSCYNEFGLAETAQRAGADYVAFGRFFPSRTKPGAVQADLALLTRARAELRVPVVAIGGITAENGPRLLAAGADILAVVHAVFRAPDVSAAARRFADLF